MESPLTLVEHVQHILVVPEKNEIPKVPLSPPDAFLVMASLLDTAGAYAHFEPAFENIRNPPDEPKYPPRFGIKLKDREKAVAVGKEWRVISNGDTHSDIKKRWTSLFKSHGQQPVREKAGFKIVPSWWEAALFLLIASDEASEGIGELNTAGEPMLISMIHHQAIDKVRDLGDFTESGNHSNESYDAATNDDYITANGSAASFALTGRKEVSNVFPKLNISSKGISHRNFSKNLTLLPSTGTVRCHWHAPQRPLKNEDSKPVNVLVIPYPFNISAKAFRPAGDHHSPEQALNPETDRGWSNFRVDQSQFEKENLIALCTNLVAAAKCDVDSIDGIVFPELAMDFETFGELCKKLREDKNTDLEFLIAGSIDNCENHEGNFVLTAIWGDEFVGVNNEDGGCESPSETDGKFAMLSSRRKHHRWMLDKGQIEEYGLASVLDPRVEWWEDCISGFRELHFYPLRKNSLMTSLICEDLARIDPCHEVLKSIGPNLIISLLMDGCQIENRWSARYAKAMSADISSSVLTLTSYALLDRVNKSGKFSESNVVGYFSSPLGCQEIKLPYSSGARGVLLCLSSEKLDDQRTIDCRPKGHRVWKLSSSRPVIPKESSTQTEN